MEYQAETQSHKSGIDGHSRKCEASLVGSAAALAGCEPDVAQWHAWIEYFLYCLEEEALFLGKHSTFETELIECAVAISARLAHGSWCSQP